MRVSGSMINNMGKVLNPGQMVQNMRVNTEMERKKARVSLPLQMEVIISDLSNKMKYQDLETTIGQMESPMKEIGQRIKWMVMVC